MAELKTNYEEAIISVKMGNHKFRFYLVPSNGAIEFTVDGEEKRNKVKEIKDNKIIFKETIELFIDNDMMFLDNVSVSDEDFAILKSEQNVINARIRKEKDKVKDWSLDKKTKHELMRMIDNHTKKVKRRKIVKDGVKQKEKYVIHNFRIGSENIRYIERCINGKVIINPDYKVRPDFERAGGIATKEGELLVWKYYYEKDEPSSFDSSRKKGFWETAREMRYSEKICFEIVSRYGEFSDKDKQSEKNKEKEQKILANIDNNDEQDVITEGFATQAS